MNVTVDISELANFSEQLKTFNAQQKDEFFEKCSKELAARLLAKLKRTPVGQKPQCLLDANKTIKVKGKNGKSRTLLSAEGAILQRYWGNYVGGTLRRGWTGGENVDGNAFANSLAVVKDGNTYSIQVENSEFYAEYVEYGHRQKVGRYVPQLGRRLKKGMTKGRYMMRNSAKEIAAIAPKLLERRLNQKLREVFDNG